MNELDGLTIYAWVGLDEWGSGKIGIKQALTRAGYVPLVAMDYDLPKLQALRNQVEEQARFFGVTIALVKLTLSAVMETVPHAE